MRISKILNRHRRDFTALYVCEHCGHEQTSTGYDDYYFHEKVVPGMKCPKCGEVAPSDYVPINPWHKSWEVV